MKLIATGENLIAREKLPLPIVNYPCFYGSFFGFQKNRNSPIIICACSKEAIENYVIFRKSFPINETADKSRMFILDSQDFPKKLIENLMTNKRLKESKIVDYLLFKEKICHECNKTTPTYFYCHEMYGGSFKRNYGWYINKKGYEYGIGPVTNYILKDKCPQEILDIVKMDPEKTTRKYYNLLRTNHAREASELNKNFQKQNRKIWNIIENEVRIIFGHKKIGEAWTSETILYYILRSLFPKYTIYRHYRPSFLQGLELDLFIKELNIGIEYQGIQHFKPIKHWGGIESFNKLIKRDKLKKEICSRLKIRLIYFNYNEGLNNNIVLSKVN